MLALLTACSSSASSVRSSSRRADVLVFTAHPDDESMYAGGILSYLRDQQRKIVLAVLTHGEGGMLLLRGNEGEMVEVRDQPRWKVARIRDRELHHVARQLHADLLYLFKADDGLDFEFTTSPEHTLAYWQAHVPGGLRTIEHRIRDTVLAYRPRVVLSMDVRDDPSGTKHGHHRAIGMLVERALSKLPQCTPHERWSFAPKDMKPDMSVRVEVSERLTLLHAHASQFDVEALQGPGSRPDEGFMLVHSCDARREPDKTLLVSWLRLATGR